MLLLLPFLRLALLLLFGASAFVGIIGVVRVRVVAVGLGRRGLTLGLPDLLVDHFDELLCLLLLGAFLLLFG